MAKRPLLVAILTTTLALTACGARDEPDALAPAPGVTTTGSTDATVPGTATASGVAVAVAQPSAAPASAPAGAPVPPASTPRVPGTLPPPVPSTTVPMVRSGQVAVASRAAYASSGVRIVGIDGSEQVDLGTGWNPVWSPDGTRVAVLRGDSEAGEDLVIVAADGSSTRTAYHWRYFGGLDDVTWDPTGTQLAFSTSLPPGSYDVGPAEQSQIRVVGADGTGERVVAAFPGENAFPEWSPDGTLIAFTQSPNGLGRVAVVRPDGLDFRVVGPQADGARAASWSPDSQHLAWVAYNGSTGNLWVVERDGSGLRRLTDAMSDLGERGPSWSPDGTHLAFTHYGSIATIGADGSDYHDLSVRADGSAVASWWDDSPSWSPDGASIAFIAYGESNRPHLATVAPDGSDRRDLRIAAELAPAWRP